MNNIKNSNKLFYFRFSGTPFPDNPESYEVGGAYINVWVNETNQKKAKSIAIKSIESEKWKVQELHESFSCDKNYYQQNNNLNKEELEEIQFSIEEALKLGVSKIFYCWDK